MPSYTSVLTICSTSSFPSSTCDSFVFSTKSDTWSSVTFPCATMNFSHCSRRTLMNSASYSCSVYHAPPVISRDGSSSKSMYTFLFCCDTLLTALMSFRASRDLKILVICACGRLLRCFSSLVHIPLFPLCWMIWYTSRSSDARPRNLTASVVFTSLYTMVSPSLKIWSLRPASRALIACARSLTGMCEIFVARSWSGMPSGCSLHCSRMAASADIVARFFLRDRAAHAHSDSIDASR